MVGGEENGKSVVEAWVAVEPDCFDSGGHSVVVGK